VRDGSGARPDALVFLTGAFHRVSRKYGSFGYRLVQLDAGAAVSQLHLVAAGLGLWSQTARPCADDLIEAQLGLDAPSEQSTAVVKLSRKACPPPARLSGGDRHGPAGQDRPASLQPARSFYEVSSADVAARAHRDSRLPELEIDRGFREGAAPRQQPVSRGIRWCDLPAPERGGASLGGILARRSSLRRYAASPVLPSQLGTMLHHASQGDATDWPEEPAAGRALKFMVLAWRLEGLAPGRYLYDPACHALGHIGPVVPAEEVCGLMVQDEFAAAPLHVWILGDLAAACARHGAWGHRQLLMRAGTACHRLWFAALGTGLGGTIVAGVVPGAVRNRLGLDGYRQAALLVFAAGQEPEDTLGGQS
jgi:hypothetical protein